VLSVVSDIVIWISDSTMYTLEGGIEQTNNICKALTVTCYPLKFALGVPLLKLAVHSVSQGLVKGLPKYHPWKALPVRQQ
jgi:hypothetical protein